MRGNIQGPVRVSGVQPMSSISDKIGWAPWPGWRTSEVRKSKELIVNWNFTPTREIYPSSR